MPDFLERALKTFVQAVIPVFVANMELIAHNIVDYGFNDWKGWLMPIIISAISAGISAVWNLCKELDLWNLIKKSIKKKGDKNE